MDVELPFDYSAIERILPHRYPFLLVDRILEFEPDRRVVGIKNVSFDEPHAACTITANKHSATASLLIRISCLRALS